MPLTVVKRDRKERARNWLACSNGCIVGKGWVSLGVHEATHFAVILDHEIPLCTPCSVEFQRIWSAALSWSKTGEREKEKVGA